MYRLNYLKFLSYTFVIVYALFRVFIVFADIEHHQSDENLNWDAESHLVCEDAVNTSSPAAIFKWTNGQWILITPWSGSLLPDTKEITCPLGHGTVIAHKNSGIYGGVDIPPTYDGYEGETFHAPFVFYTSYVGTCYYPKKLKENPVLYEFDTNKTATIIKKSPEISTEEDFSSSPSDITDRKTELEIKEMNIIGEWNKWNTHRFMGYEKIKIQIETDQEVDRVEIRFSPELEAMHYVNSKGMIYNYCDELGYIVNFPLAAKKIGDTPQWEAEYILPIAKSTVSWKNVRLTDPYKVYLKAYGDELEISEEMELDLTGNIYDLIYIRPIVK